MLGYTWESGAEKEEEGGAEKESWIATDCDVSGGEADEGGGFVGTKTESGGGTVDTEDWEADVCSGADEVVDVE